MKKNRVFFCIGACIALISIGLISIALSSGLAYAAPGAIKDRGNLLFPYYSQAELLSSVIEHHHANMAHRLEARVSKLSESLGDFCEGQADQQVVKNNYAQTMLAWHGLSAVVWGPMLEKNTVRQIDFRPFRQNLLERAIQKQPRNPQDMALIGSPAKGFPALEHLLFVSPLQPDTPACQYAVQLGRDIHGHLAGLEWQTPPVENMDESEQAQSLFAGMQAYFNQVVGGVHHLSWEQIEKPRLKAIDQQLPLSQAQWPLNQLSMTPQAWRAQWAALSDLLVLKADAVPDPDHEVVPLEAYLLGLGQIELADGLSSRCQQLDASMSQLDSANPVQIEVAVNQLNALETFLKQDVARGLKVSIQFSSSDGD